MNAAHIPALAVERPYADDDVVDYAPIAGPTFGGGNPLVLLEAGIDREVLISHLAGRRNFEGLGGNVEHFVRLADLPALDKLLGRWQLRFVAFRCTGIDPVVNQLFFGVAE